MYVEVGAPTIQPSTSLLKQLRPYFLVFPLICCSGPSGVKKLFTNLIVVRSDSTYSWLNYQMHISIDPVHVCNEPLGADAPPLVGGGGPCIGCAPEVFILKTMDSWVENHVRLRMEIAVQHYNFIHYWNKYGWSCNQVEKYTNYGIRDKWLSWIIVWENLLKQLLCEQMIIVSQR
jgi:hypothetical protein